MDFAAVSDPSNPFATKGLSRECLALIQYVIDAKATTGHDLVITSTTDHPPKTTAGYPSRHVMAATDGDGLAIDLRMRQRGTDKGLHRPAFDIFTHVERSLHELIYGWAPYNVKAGKRVALYARSSHLDHVHVAIGHGLFLVWPFLAPKEAKLRVPNPVDACRAPHGGFWILSRDGAVYAFGGAPYLDAYNAHPEWHNTDRSFVAIERNERGGYDCIADDGSLYSFPV